MRKKIVAILFTFFVVAAAWADEPWRDKSYKQWDDKDLRRILTDSPWTRAVRPDSSDKIKHLALDAPVDAPAVAGKTGEGEEDDQDKDEKDEKEERPGAKSKENEAKSKVTFFVRWVSSRTLREASVRGQMMQGRMSDADAEKFVLESPEDYQLVVVGQDMSSFQQVEQPKLIQGSRIHVKKSKLLLAPTSVEIVRSADGKKVNAIVFHFPKKTPSGESIIAPDEREVEFECRSGNIRLKVEFQIQTMVDQRGLDI